MTIREMAELVATQNCKGKINVIVKVPDNLESLGYLNELSFILNIDKMKKTWMDTKEFFIHYV